MDDDDFSIKEHILYGLVAGLILTIIIAMGGGPYIQLIIDSWSKVFLWM